MIDFFRFESASIDGLGPIFYADDVCLVKPYKACALERTLDVWDLTDVEFPSKPWRRKKFPLHSCYHRHLDGVIFVNPSSMDTGVSVVANHAIGGAQRALYRLSNKALCVALNGDIRARWNSGKTALIVRSLDSGAITYCHMFFWASTDSAVESQGRTTYRSYYYDASDGALYEGPSRALGSMTYAEFQIRANDLKPTAFEGTRYGGVGWSRSVTVTYEEDITENVLKLSESINLGIAGHYPMARDTDRSMFDSLLNRIRPDRVNLAEFAIGFKDLPKYFLSLPTVVKRNLLDRIKRRRPEFNRRRKVSRAMRDAISGGYLTTKDVAGVYLGYLYGLLPTPGDLKNLDQMRDAISRARKEFQVDLRTRRSYSKEGWNGYQAAQVLLCQLVNDYVPEIDQLIDSGRLRVAHGLAFQNARTFLDDCVERLARCGYPASPEEVLLNLWELIPYSFVVDWFAGIGDAIERLSNDRIWSSLPVDFSCRSVKAEKDVSGDIASLATSLRVNVTCDVAAFSYDRYYVLGRVDYSPFVEGSGSVSSQHWVEGVALGFQRAPRRSGAHKASLY